MPDPVADPVATDRATLYQEVPERFIAARGALVKRLKSEGRTAEAAQVAKLRRPPLTAWALNQVARAAPELLTALHQAGDGLRQAMERALGGDASALRPARAEERSAVDAIVADAERRTQDAGYTTTDVMRQRMAATLRAAIVDEEVAAPLRDGVLDADHEAPGFGMDGLTISEPPSTVPPVSAGAAGEGAPPPAAASSDAEATTLTPLRERARREADRLTVEAAALTAEADRLAAEGDRLAAEAAALSSEADRLAAESERARARSSQSRREADQALERAAAQWAEVEALAAPLEGGGP